MSFYCGKFVLNPDQILYKDLCDARGLVTIYFVNGQKLELDDVSSEEARSESDIDRGLQRIDDERDHLALELDRAHLKEHS